MATQWRSYLFCDFEHSIRFIPTYDFISDQTRKSLSILIFYWNSNRLIPYEIITENGIDVICQWDSKWNGNGNGQWFVIWVRDWVRNCEFANLMTHPNHWESVSIDILLFEFAILSYCRLDWYWNCAFTLSAAQWMWNCNNLSIYRLGMSQSVTPISRTFCVYILIFCVLDWHWNRWRETGRCSWCGKSGGATDLYREWSIRSIGEGEGNGRAKGCAFWVFITM